MLPGQLRPPESPTPSVVLVNDSMVEVMEILDDSPLSKVCEQHEQGESVHALSCACMCM